MARVIRTVDNHQRFPFPIGILPERRIPRTRNNLAIIGLSGISIMVSPGTSNVHLTASACNSPAQLSVRGVSRDRRRPVPSLPEIPEPKLPLMRSIPSTPYFSPASLVIEICSDLRLAYPAGNSSAAILRSMSLLTQKSVRAVNGRATRTAFKTAIRSITSWAIAPAMGGR